MIRLYIPYRNLLFILFFKNNEATKAFHYDIIVSYILMNLLCMYLGTKTYFHYESGPKRFPKFYSNIFFSIKFVT